MVSASSNENNLVLDPFSGSGTTLRVCQQLNRNCIGYELNPAYVEMTKERLSKPFDGFDSIDPRMERVPNDLRKKEIRDEYINNHIKWFLKNHSGSLEKFKKEVQRKYGKFPNTSADVQPVFPLFEEQTADGSLFSLAP